MNELDYDLGYYEGIRYTVSYLISRMMYGEDIQDIVKALAQLRDDARAQYDETKKYDEEEDDW